MICISPARHYSTSFFVAALLLGPALAAHGAWIWIEGEQPSKATMNRHPWWYDQVKKENFSGSDFISNFHESKAGEAEYQFKAPEPGKYDFWVRANPVQAKLAYRLNDGKWTDIDLSKNQVGNVNVAADGKPDLRFIAWSKVDRSSSRKERTSSASKWIAETAITAI